jgi:amidase
MTDAIDLCLLSACEQRALLRERKTSARELIEAQIWMIERLDPALTAIVTRTFDAARHAADAADRQIAQGSGVHPLTGLTVAHKDTIATRGIRTTFGSPLYADHVPEHDALIVERMAEAGAITLGKTNVPEFAAGSQTYNRVFGATRNPYDTTRTSGGSSGGAAAALATGMTSLASGTDLGGSLRNPGSFCNVVGLRPSPGRVPIWPSTDSWDPFAVQGPLGRTVADVALQLGVLAGPDSRSPMSSYAADPAPRSLERDLQGTRVAWSRNLGGLPVDPAVTAVLEENRRVLDELGCVVEELEPDFSGANEVFLTWRGWLFELNWGMHYDNHRDQLGEDVRWNIEVGRRLTGVDLVRATRLREALYERMRGFFARYEYLLAPVAQVVPFPVEETYPRVVDGVPMHNYIDWMRSCYYVSAAGLPAASVPFGFTPEGLPVGLQVIAANGHDWAVLQLAHAIERATAFHKRRPAGAVPNV